MENLKEALQETNVLTVFSKQESIDVRAGNTLRYSWESLDKLKSCSLSENPTPITEENGDVVYEREMSFSISQRVARIDKDYLTQLRTKANYTAMPEDQRRELEAALDNIETDGATNTLTRKMELEDTGVVDDEGNAIYRENETFEFSRRGQGSVNDVTGHELSLTEDKRNQYLDALRNVDSGTDFTMTTVGNEVTYSWNSLDQAETYMITKSMVRVEVGKDAQGNPIYDKEVGKWDFVIQTRVRKSEVAKWVANLPEGSEREQYLKALRDTASWTRFFKTVGGLDVNYKWTGRNGAISYSLSKMVSYAEGVDASVLYTSERWSSHRRCV
jgi:hypothetical protein